MPPYKTTLVSRPSFRVFSSSLIKLGIFLFFGCILSKSVNSQIQFDYFQQEIDKLRNDRKVEKYWRELYRDDRENIRLKVPMDSMLLINRLKAAYLIQKHGFPTPQRYGKNSNRIFLSIVTNNCSSDINTITFPQVVPADELRLWGGRYPNALMVNELFWYNGIEIALDQEFALALRRLESRSLDSINMIVLCQKASDLLLMMRTMDTRTIGEWTMNYRELQIPIKIKQLKDKYYLQKGKYYFELKREGPDVFSFMEKLDGTTLFIFENGELVLRDMYDREMGIFPVAKTAP
jgi:hypothetical protein